MMECKTCKFWTKHKMGDCSQKMLTQQGLFVNVQTRADYGCSQHEDDIKKMDVRFWQDERGVHHSGTTSKQYINDIINYLQNLKDEE